MSELKIVTEDGQEILVNELTLEQVRRLLNESLIDLEALLRRRLKSLKGGHSVVEIETGVIQ